MIPQHLASVTAELPYRLRDEIEGYVKAVDAAAADIAQESGVELTKNLRDQFLFVVGIRRLWTIIDGSHWLAVDASVLFEKADAPRVEAGSLSLGPGEKFTRELQRLHARLAEILVDQELIEPMGMSHMSEVMVWVDGTG